MDANLTNRYRDLCKAEYRKRKADESGDIGEIKQAQANLTDMLKLLKLNDFQSNQKSETEKMIERKIWMIENTKPAECEDLEIYKDVSGFETTWNHILRCVKNLVAGSREYPDVPREERG
jgi:CRISPR/Cas system CSM-associated protein Csm5 (group 7 of RAMP superfamily)